MISYIHKWWSKLSRGLFGYDFFISYSREDASIYATTLASVLIGKKYSCYVDQWGTSPGEKLPPKLIRAIKSSSVFILVASEKAIHSANIGDEIDHFLTTKRPIIPLDFGNIKQAVWYNKVQGIAVTVISPEQLTELQITNSLIERISNSFTYVRQSGRIRRSIITVLILLLALASGLGFFFNQSMVISKEVDAKNIRLTTLNDSIRISKTELKEQEEKLDSVIIDSERQISELNIEIKQAENTADSLSKLKENYLLAARNKEASASNLLKFVEDGIASIYAQPDISGCRLENASEQNPLTIYVYLDRYNVNPAGKKLLDEVYNCIIQYPDEYEIIVCGHNAKYYWLNPDAEAGGNEDLSASELVPRTKQYSQMISQRMAHTVVSYLESKGVPPETIIAKGYGLEKPKYDFDFLNNRVEIWFMKKNW